MYFCGGHYRHPIDFDEQRLGEAAASVQRIQEAARRLLSGRSPDFSPPLRERFFDALAEDFNTPRALAALFDWVREANRAQGTVGDHDLRDMLAVLGLENLLDVRQVEIPAEVRELSDRRERARAEGDYAAADRLREELRELGWDVRDSPDGAELLPAQ